MANIGLGLLVVAYMAMLVLLMREAHPERSSTDEDQTTGHGRHRQDSDREASPDLIARIEQERRRRRGW